METKEKEFIDIFLKEDEKYVQLINLFHLKNNGILDLYKELYNEGSIIKIKSCMKSVDKMVEVLNNLDEYSLTKSYNDSNEKILKQFKNKIKYKNYVKLSSIEIHVIQSFYYTIRKINETDNINYIDKCNNNIEMIFNDKINALELLDSTDIYFLKEFQKEFKDDFQKMNLYIKNILTVNTFDLEALNLCNYKQNQKWEYIISKKDYDAIFGIINNEKHMNTAVSSSLNKNYTKYGYEFQKYIDNTNKMIEQMKIMYNEKLCYEFGEKYFICEECKDLIDIYNDKNNVDINDVIFDVNGKIQILSEYNTDSSGHIYCNKCAGEKLTCCSICGARYTSDEIHGGICGNCDDEETI